MRRVSTALPRIAALVVTLVLAVSAVFVVRDGHRSGVAAHLASSPDTFVPGDDLGADAAAFPAPVADGGARSTPDGTAFGDPGASALVLYDRGGPEPEQGELHGLNAALLASHFGTVTVQAASEYRAGMAERFDALLYVGHDAGATLPDALLADVRTTETPVIWAGENVAQLAGLDGEDARSFRNRYGWDPTTVQRNDVDLPAAVRYGDHLLRRDTVDNASGLLPPVLGDAGEVTLLAEAPCGDPVKPSACAGPGWDGHTALPWAIRSANLTYVAEIPFLYVEENDRYLAYADLLYDALGADVEPVRQAAVRLEDISPVSDPERLRSHVDYLSSQGVPFSLAVIPRYLDPTGVENSGRPTSVTLAQAPELVAALQYAVAHGGTLLQHGTTHQFQYTENPYNALSGADFEFAYATCDPAVDQADAIGVCDRDSDVFTAGPIGPDSVAGWQARIRHGRELFVEAGLPAPEIFETPHYAASPNAYRAMSGEFRTRYERVHYPTGLLTGEPPGRDILSVHFPFRVSDPFGMTVLPENLGNYAPVSFSGHPPRGPQDIVDNARANLAVRESTASFFFHAYLPTEQLAETVAGIRDLGYTFVPAAELR